MHVPCPLLQIRRFAFVIQLTLKRPLTLTRNKINRDLQSIGLVLIGFLKRLFEVPNNNDICIVQVPIYIRLLTIACCHNKGSCSNKKTLVNRPNM